MRQRPLVTAVVAVALLAVVGTNIYGRMERSASARRGPPPVPVTVIRAVRQDVPITLQGLGTAQALNSVIVKPRVEGILEAVAFTEGQTVKVGDVLARIDPRPYRAALDQAMAKKNQDEAQLPSAVRDLERFESLARSNFAAEQTLERQRSTVAQLKAAIKADAAAADRAQIDLGYTTIISPIEGRIGLRQVDVGNVVRVSDPNGLAVISQVRPISVVFTLPANDLPDITKAMRNGPAPVAVHRYDNAEKLADGELLAIDSAIDQSTGTIRLKATFANQDDSLWPGESVRAQLRVRVEKDAIVIPEPAVQRGPNGFFVYVTKPDSTVAVQPIDVLDVGSGIVIVTRGLAADDTVVTSGHSRLRPGAAVKATDPSSPASDPPPTRGPKP